MDELLKNTFQRLYEEHKFMKECGLYNHEINKFVAEEFYKIGYNRAIDEFAEQCFEEIFKHGYPLNSLDITVIADQMKAE